MTSCRFSRRPAYVSLSRVVTRQSGCCASANRTKLLPMNPAPPVTRTSTILACPVVGERIVRRETVLIRPGVSIGFVRYVDDKGCVGADALPAVVDEVRHLNERRVLDADEEFVDRTLRGRIRSRIHEDKLYHAGDAREVVHLLPMIVPGFDHPGIGG